MRAHSQDSGIEIHTVLASGADRKNAITAEREGYDVFVLAGMRDIGLNDLNEAVVIQVVFSGFCT